MKSLKLAVIVSKVILGALMLSVAGLAQADANRLNQNFISKRAYQAPVENNKTNKVDEQFEGATSISEDASDENSTASKNERNLKQLRLHSLGRRPYME
jgi:hypothetical protein